MEIRTLNPKQLREFIYSGEFRNMEVVPISRHRALSHIRNPRVEQDDVILLLAYEREKLLGYLGVFADTIYLNEKPHHAGWLSCLWVDPVTRGQGIAKKLLAKALECWDQRILVTEFTPAAKGLYDRTGIFLDLKKPAGLRGYMRFNTHYLLPPKKKIFLQAKPLLHFGDRLLNSVNDLRLRSFRRNSQQDELRWVFVNEVDEESWKLIQTRQQHQFTRRNREDLNWMLRNPWVLSTPFPDRFSQRYHFTSRAKRFQFLPVKFFNRQDEVVAFVILSIRNQHLKVPYAYFETGNVGEVAHFIIQTMLHEKLDMVSIFQQELVDYFKTHSTPFIVKRSMHRHYIISNVFEKELQETKEINLQDGDADAAFT